MITKLSFIIKELARSNQPILIISSAQEEVARELVSSVDLPESAISQFSPVDGVEELRELIKDLYTKPLASDVKYFFVNSCDALNQEQSNTILKLTEEPPAYLRIILLAKNESKILPTIKSRVKRFVLAHANQSHDSETSFSDLLTLSFSDFSAAINKLERDGFTNLLLQGIEESRENLLNKEALEKYKMLVSSLAKITNTNVNFRLLAEELYLFQNK